MKRNLRLLGILALLLTITWWLQERRIEIDAAKTSEREAIYNPKTLGQVKLIEFGDVKISFDSDSAYVGEQKILADTMRVNEVFAALDGLAAVRFLEPEEAQALDESFAFPPNETSTIRLVSEKGETIFKLGAKLSMTPAQFYGKINDTYVILHDRRPLAEAYQAGEESDLKEQRLRTTFTLSEPFFYDHKIFKKTMIFHQASLDNNLVKPFKIDLKAMRTKPVPYAGLGYDEAEFERWYFALQSLRAEVLHIRYDPKKLKKYRAGIDLIDDKNQSYTLSLFGRYGSLEGDFLISSLDQHLYELTDNDAGVFFQNVQDFWQINLLPNNQVMELDLSDGTINVSLEIFNQERFEVNVKDEKLEPRRDRLAVLHAMLTTRARYVSEGASSELDALFAMKSMGRSFSFAEREQEWLVIDQANALTYHYLKRDFPDLPAKLADYFGKNK